MENVSDRFLAEIRRSHIVYSYVEVLTPTNLEKVLPVIGGDVQVDGTAAIQRRCTITCVDPTGELTPENAESVLAPNGTEIRPFRGVLYDDGTNEVVPLGVFRISKVSVSDSSGGSPSISIEAFDLSRTVSRDKFIAPYIIAAGTDILTAIKAILALTFPDLDYDVTSSELALTSPNVYDVGDDPWEICVKLASSLGCSISFDNTGRVEIAPPTDIAALPSPDFTYIEGPGCTMLDLDRVLSDEPGFNGVVVTGESPGDELPPVRAVVWDNEPTSPTYHLGPYGEVPTFITDQVVKTVAEATAVASAALNAQLGYTSTLSITASTNPALEVGDVVQVERERSHVTGLYVVDAFNVPLVSSGTQSIALRQTQEIGGDE